MVGTEALLPDSKGAPVERLRFAIAALRGVKRCKSVQRLRDVCVVWIERLLPDNQRALIQCLRIAIAALRVVEPPKVLNYTARFGWSGPSAFSQMAKERT